MFKKDNFFKNDFIKSKKYDENLIKTKKIFKKFLLDLKTKKIRFLESFDKNYKYNFSSQTVKKFSKYKCYFFCFY